MNKLVDREIHLDLSPWKHTAYLLAAFQMKAVFEGWSDTEIDLVSNQIKFEKKEKQFEILSQYCNPEIQSEVALTMSDVFFLLAHLNMETHYLARKEIETWDEYDWANYMRLKRRATSSIKRVYGLYSGSIDPEFKYEVTTPSAHLYASFEEAEEAIPDEQKSYTKVYPLWIKN